MSYLMRCLAILSMSMMLIACSSGGGERPAQEPTSPDIKDIMGYSWGGGKDMLSDLSKYQSKNTSAGVSYSYTGDPYGLEGLDVEISEERFEFVDGGLVGAELVGDDFDDMEKLRASLVEKYGEPGESSDGYYKWVSATGTLVLDDVEDYWSLMGWSADAPDYWQ